MSDETEAAEAARRRRQTFGKIVASLLLAGAAIVLWASSLLPWARVEAEDGLSPMRSFTVKGSDWSPWLTPVALALLASIAVVWSLRGWALRVFAILLALGAVVIAIPAISLLSSTPSSDYAARAIDLSPRYRVLLTTTNPWVPVVILVAAALLAVAAVFALRAARGAGMSSRYQSPAARREELERQVFAEHERRKRAEAAGERADGNERTLWDSLDGGVDPTE
ncbi:hypothetical protein GOARA_052_00120 [Gordonia araii NBRC 100433]|uniref:TIGR02234 family membrane protein n=1 Tax=Gordonia araii NBRC 100433 TaxID=1073574 RepID=G7H2N8_9ACTN|nr:TIGR02234 family membrane protein [Gordonia araii]NNG98561.1 TIGR02234 family membrane protein [Gordonia araii NBRC 100433]GAB10113.1 hypothetical protein GOARA_052_00120 [Gordonia araii NBRC 100433]